MSAHAKLRVAGALVLFGTALHACRGTEVRQGQAGRTELSQPASGMEAPSESGPGVDTLSAPRPAAIENLPPDALQRVAAFFAARAAARYMEKNCQATTYPGWEGYPLIRCRYEVSDADERNKSAEVIMLNPSPQTLAAWIVDACLVVSGGAESGCTERLSRRILEQSGGQFPVAGIVFEDILPADGIYEMYCFRDGVTVGVEGVAHRGTHQPTDEEIRASLFGQVLWSGAFARLQGTTREEYRENGGAVDVGDSSRSNRKLVWLQVVRAQYQAAWDDGRNELLIAWARGNL